MPVTVALPSLPAVQLTLVWLEIELVNTTGSVIVTLEILLLHPFASVTVTEYVPDVKLTAVCVVCAGNGSFHK